ncbi:MAG: endolytic transglycosylase MltG [Acetobacteraceae bacterium]
MPRSSSVLPPDGIDGRREAPPPKADAPTADAPKATGRWLRYLLASLCTALLIAAASGAAIWRFQAPGPLPEANAVVIPPGSTSMLARELSRAGVIDAPRLFTLAALATSGAGPLHAAELLFPAHASFADVLSVLRTAAPVEHRLVIPEGLTAKEITALMLAAPGLVGPVDLPGEGYVLPATYDYLYGTERNRLVQNAHRALERRLAKLWAQRAPDLPFTDPRQALTLASIVERETAVPGERPRIAAVFINRLRLGMKLQSDPTVIYAASGGKGVLSRPLSAPDLAINSPYNTYVVAGLPPGPIDAPGIASIKAVLHPMTSPDLYFVADGHGGHSFARTLTGQIHNIHVWEQHLRQTVAPPER